MVVKRNIAGSMTNLGMKNLGHRRWWPVVLGPTHSRLRRRVAARLVLIEAGFWLLN
jgi:hypothetical protein